MSKSSKNKFENTIADLEKMIAVVESDKTSLEQSLETFEKGINLVRSAQDYLAQAEQKVTLLTEHKDSPASDDFNDSAE